MAKKRTNLQPWLDYFKMLQQYEQKGFLEIKPQEHEAYATRAALLTLVPEADGTVTDPAPNPAPTGVGSATPSDAELIALLTRLRAYAAYRWAPAVGQQHPADMNDLTAPLPVIPKAELTVYLSQPFAVHVVKEDYPHDLLLTLLLQQKRSWRTAWRTIDTIEVIDYTEKAKSDGANN